jgi:hypothetical protein
MRRSICLLTLASLALVGCASEPTTITATTTTREVTTTGPASEVVVARTPPPVRVETPPLAPGLGYVWTGGYWRWTGADYVRVSGSWVIPPRSTAVWSRDTGRTERSAGCRTPVTASKQRAQQPNYI